MIIPGFWRNWMNKPSDCIISKDYKENEKYKYELFTKEVLLISNFNEYFRKVSIIVFYLVPS